MLTKEKLKRVERKKTRFDWSAWWYRYGMKIFFFYLYYPEKLCLKIKENIGKRRFEKYSEYSDELTQKFIDKYLYRFFKNKNKYYSYGTSEFYFTNEPDADIKFSEFENPLQKSKNRKVSGYGYRFRKEIYDYAMFRYCPEGYRRMYFSENGHPKAPELFDWTYKHLSYHEKGVVFYDPDKFVIDSEGYWTKMVKFNEPSHTVFGCSVCGMLSDKVSKECPFCNSKMYELVTKFGRENI